MRQQLLESPSMPVSQQELVQFRLYIAGSAPNSRRALTNLYELCQRYLPQRHAIEVIDILAEPARALADHVLVTPTLVKLAPAPRQQFVGDLSERSILLSSLGIPEQDHGSVTRQS